MDFTRLNELSATVLIPLLRKGDISNQEIVRSVLSRIDSVEESLQCFITLRDRNDLLKEAAAIDKKRAQGAKIGALNGLPIAIKDNICTKALRTTCASKMLEHYTPQYNATVVEKIRAADGIVLGKTNMDEFAMGSSTENSAFQITRNPHNQDYVPGGTSGGSAAAVAAHETILAIGSDTGGSVRQPASYCGVVGLKPSYGRVSRYGLIAYASSLDQIGTLTKTVDDAELLFSIISGHDPRDSTSTQNPTHEDRRDQRGPLRIGIPKEYFIEGVDPEVIQGCQRVLGFLNGSGHETLHISLANTKYAVPVYYIVACAEMSSNLARFDSVRYGYRALEFTSWRNMMTKSRTKGFGPEVRRRIILGTYVLSAGYIDAYYNQANKVRSLIRLDFEKAFSTCDLILTPVAPTPAFKIGEKIDDPLTMYLVDIFSVTANLTGLPGISVPCGFSRTGLPLSIQLIGPMFSERLLLRVAHEIEIAVNNEHG